MQRIDENANNKVTAMKFRVIAIGYAIRKIEKYFDFRRSYEENNLSGTGGLRHLRSQPICWVDFLTII
jgi:hypothetical protein